MHRLPWFSGGGYSLPSKMFSDLALYVDAVCSRKLPYFQRLLLQKSNAKDFLRNSKCSKYCEDYFFKNRSDFPRLTFVHHGIIPQNMEVRTRSFALSKCEPATTTGRALFGSNKSAGSYVITFLDCSQGTSFLLLYLQASLNCSLDNKLK